MLYLSSGFSKDLGEPYVDGGVDEGDTACNFTGNWVMHVVGTAADPAISTCFDNCFARVCGARGGGRCRPGTQSHLGAVPSGVWESERWPCCLCLLWGDLV